MAANEFMHDTVSNHSNKTLLYHLIFILTLFPLGSSILAIQAEVKLVKVEPGLLVKHLCTIRIGLKPNTKLTEYSAELLFGFPKYSAEYFFYKICTFHHQNYAK